MEMYNHEPNLLRPINAISTPRKVAALAGTALIIAGPNPLKRAEIPSLATVLRAQSTKPVYAPVGAAWSRDLITYHIRFKVHQIKPCVSEHQVIQIDEPDLRLVESQSTTSPHPQNLSNSNPV